MRAAAASSSARSGLLELVPCRSGLVPPRREGRKLPRPRHLDDGCPVGLAAVAQAIDPCDGAGALIGSGVVVVRKIEAEGDGSGARVVGTEHAKQVGLPLEAFVIGANAWVARFDGALADHAESHHQAVAVEAVVVDHARPEDKVIGGRPNPAVRAGELARLVLRAAPPPGFGRVVPSRLLPIVAPGAAPQRDGVATLRAEPEVAAG